MQRYFVDIIDNKVIFNDGDEHHILHVMRMKKSDELIAINQGQEYLCEIVFTSPLQVKLKEKLTTNNELNKKVTLFFALAKGDKNELVIQKACELGVSRIVLIKTRYCVSKFDDITTSKKIKRYISIAKEACEQCHRQLIPEILGVYDIDKIPANLLAGNNYVAYEKYNGCNCLKANGDSISVLIGPEGGLDKSEIELLVEKYGFKPISLGKRILRTETAAISALSVLGYLIEYESV